MFLPRSCHLSQGVLVCSPTPHHLSWGEETRTPLDCHPEKLACLMAWLNILTGGSQYKSLKPIEHSSWWGRLCYSNDRNRRLEARTAQSSGRKAKPKVSLELPTGGLNLTTELWRWAADLGLAWEWRPKTRRPFSRGVSVFTASKRPTDKIPLKVEVMKTHAKAFWPAVSHQTLSCLRGQVLFLNKQKDVVSWSTQSFQEEPQGTTIRHWGRTHVL